MKIRISADLTCDEMMRAREELKASLRKEARERRDTFMRQMIDRQDELNAKRVWEGEGGALGKTTEG